MTLTRAFAGRARRAVAGGMLVAAGGCGHKEAPCPDPVKEDAAVNCDKSGALPFAFESAAAPTIFGAQGKGMFNDDLSDVATRFYGMVGRQQVLMRNPDNAASFNAWLAQLEPYRNAAIWDKAVAVDALVDTMIKLASDKALYGKATDSEDYDYWASPIETLTALHDGRRGWGDCEDLAFLKLYALRYLDVPDDKAYAVFVNIRVPQDKPLGHVVTMVDVAESSGGKQVFAILNNKPNSEGVLEREIDNLNYTAYYAMNERGIVSLPANSITSWGAPQSKERACLPPVNPDLWRNVPLLKTP